MNICFDCDGCLIDKVGKPIVANWLLVKTLSKSHKVFIWSGNGWEYAFLNTTGLQKYVSGYLNKYGTFKPDIAFDDQEIDLGRLNIKI